MKDKIFDDAGFQADIGSKRIHSILKEILKDREESYCYYQYPIYYTESNTLPSLTLIDKEFGVVVFKILRFSLEELDDINEGYWKINNEIHNNIHLEFEEYCYKFKNDINNPIHKLFGKVNFKNYIVFPFIEEKAFFEKFSFVKDQMTNLLFQDTNYNEIFNYKTNELEDDKWNRLRSIVQNLPILTRRKTTKIETPNNLNEAIIYNNQSICVFDDEQEEAAQRIPNSGMRIRGLAGSGKTIIIAWKAAILHYKYPSAKILVTFYTRSLYNQIKNYIAKFYRKYASDEPNWDLLQVHHSWGGASKEGVYYNVCKKIGAKPKSFSDVRHFKYPFGKICEELLKFGYKITPEYDYVLIDEAQDMPNEFFKLAERLTKSPKRIYIAYDELQTTEDIGIKPFTELFGHDRHNEPIVPLEENNDIILKRTYRNHFITLNTAVAFGFGFYSPNGMVQIMEEKSNWDAIGYSIESGELESNNEIILHRDPNNNPNDVLKVFSKYDVINVNKYDDIDSEIDNIGNMIIKIVKEEKVKPEDIIVINMNTSKIKEEFQLLRLKLLKNNIYSKIPGVLHEADDFMVEGHVTLTTFRRAKGNEASIIFIINANKMYDYKNSVLDRIIRSSLFISLTRSKGWCFISGHGTLMDDFIKEYEKIIKYLPKIKFTYPSQARIDDIRKINYITQDEERKKEFNTQIKLIEELDETELEYLKYLPNDLKDKLKKIIDNIED